MMNEASLLWDPLERKPRDPFYSGLGRFDPPLTGEQETWEPYLETRRWADAVMDNFMGQVWH